MANDEPIEFGPWEVDAVSFTLGPADPARSGVLPAVNQFRWGASTSLGWRCPLRPSVA
jgi:hypothetical protein